MSDGAGAGLFEVAGGFGRTGVGGAGDAALSRLQPAINKMALQNVAHMRDHPEPTLTDLPVRVLLGTLGRQVPDTAALVRDLERLLA